MSSKISKNSSKKSINTINKIRKSFIDRISKNKMELLQQKHQDVRIEKLNSSFELESLNKWIINNLNEDELISFFINKKHIEKFKVTITKKQDLYNIRLGTNKMMEIFSDDLFLNFLKICGVANLKDILVCQIELYHESTVDCNEHNSYVDPDPW